MKFRTIRNLTPHPITVDTDSGPRVFGVAGRPVRLLPMRRWLGEVEVDGLSINVAHTILGDVACLPFEQPDVLLVVSSAVAEHPSLRSRRDLAYPGEPVRDSDGRVVACLGLCAGPGLAAKFREA
mgnify:CR=1 FL=1